MFNDDSNDTTRKGSSLPVAPSKPVNFNPQKPMTVALSKVYVHAGHEKIYFGRGGDIARGGLFRVKVKTLGPQRDPTHRLSDIKNKVDNFKSWLFAEPTHLVEDENGEFYDVDGGGRALMAHIMRHPTIEAFVSHDVSPEKRAQMFREHANSRVDIGKAQEFIARAAERQPREVGILNALAPNYVVAKNGKDAINAVNSLYAIWKYGEHAPDLLRRTAQLAAAAWKPRYAKGKKGTRGKLERAGFHVPGIVLVALACVIESLPKKVNEEKLRKILADNSPQQLRDAASSNIVDLANASGKRNPTAAFRLLSQQMTGPIANVIIRAYNDRLAKEFSRIELNPKSALLVMGSKVRSSIDPDNS